MLACLAGLPPNTISEGTESVLQGTYTNNSDVHGVWYQYPKVSKSLTFSYWFGPQKLS